MEEIQKFLKEFVDRYPFNWYKINELVSFFVKNESKDLLEFESKYLKPHLPTSIDGIISYVPREKIDSDKITSDLEFFELNLFDCAQLVEDLGEDSFEVEEWAQKQLDYEINMVRVNLNTQH